MVQHNVVHSKIWNGFCEEKIAIKDVRAIYIYVIEGLFPYETIEPSENRFWDFVGNSWYSNLKKYFILVLITYFANQSPE